VAACHGMWIDGKEVMPKYTRPPDTAGKFAVACPNTLWQFPAAHPPKCPGGVGRRAVV
jgi:hypothetical protein